MAFDHTGARMTAARFCFGVLMLALAAACATGPKKPPVGTLEPDKFLWERGTESLNAKKWFTAREYFRQLVDSYPQSTYRADGKLGIGDSYLGEATLESNLMAINEYQEFLSFYPTHRRADYAQFKLGMAHYYQMRNPQRDQTETKEAITEFNKFLQRFPNSELAPEVRTHLREARDRLSESEYRVGLFYYRTMKWYPGAVDRFMSVLRDDPEFTNRDAVYFYLAQSLMAVGRPAEALPYLDRLIAEFEQSEYLERARKQVDEIKTSLTKKTGSVTNAY
jgi:outer membrane protein assembly factor BamD